jgi:glycerate-2-kinase
MRSPALGALIDVASSLMKKEDDILIRIEDVKRVTRQLKDVANEYSHINFIRNHILKII